MNPMNERFKEVRKAMKQTQIEFATRLGFSQSTITMIECGDRTVTDRHVKVLCSIYNVNEHWLRTGEGNMFVDDDEMLLSQLAERYSLDDEQMAIVKNFLSLDKQQRQVIVDAICHTADDIRQTRIDRRQKAHDALDKALDDEEKDASALSSTDSANAGNSKRA